MTKWVPKWRASESGFKGVANADLFQEVDALVRTREKPVSFVRAAARALREPETPWLQAC